MPPPLIDCRWPVPGRVQVVSTTRHGGVSEAPWDSFNLAEHVGDDADAVQENRRRLAALLPPGTCVQWLQQVHGNTVVQAGHSVAPMADACWTDQAGLACAIMTADCLPVLLCDPAGTVVAAAHAGWRGLAGGVLESTVAAMGLPPGELRAWMGPAIGPHRFEVGVEVREQFLDLAPLCAHDATADCFHTGGARPGHWMGDLYSLARLRLAAVGVTAIHGGGWCTASDADRFYSYRRDGITGRMASLILIRPDGAGPASDQNRT